MSELREKRWSVVSERGCEVSSVDYAEAAELVRRLRADKVHGLCIVSDEAARRYNNSNNNHQQTATPIATPTATQTSTASALTPPTKRRAPRRKSAKLS
ncbi:MAG TPA: hypothetical protein VGW12_18560 [Pyrinomonadaceae bacterium]|nr:hypothetical protein [Pyrinomonadaceae bacterium]